ncbi:MAG: hypothetical protein ACRC8B_22840 [Aeromonas sobria]|uniref:hypothetical protein n=1 Tax=Aeromonas sobria TaxID=646 RepID=UPI003F2E2056
MSAKPLTKAEAKWIAELQALLNKCPSKRMVAYTIGDPELVIYDSSFSSAIGDILDNSKKDVCQAVTMLGADLASITFPFPVESTAG